MLAADPGADVEDAAASAADFERMADEAEAGRYPGKPGEWVVRP